MFQRFDQNNNISNFVKALIAQTDIPTVHFGGIPTGASGIYINNGYTFYKKLEEKPIMYDPYIWGKPYKGLTTRYISNNSYYDGETHYYLGEYLRAIRGNFKIDLMPYYNCFNNTYSKDIYLTPTGFDVTSKDTGYQVILVPVKFGQKYTIAIDCPSPVLIQPLFYGNKGITNSSNLNRVSNKISNLRIKKSSSNFRDPFLYDKLENVPETIMKDPSSPFLYERFLKLAIQLPINLKSSIVVLEGDYTKHIIGNDNVYNSLSENQLNEVLKSPLSLLQLPTSYPVAFSNRLIEYLTQNVITSADVIDEDIKRVQNYASSNINKLKNGSSLSPTHTKGVWDSTLRVYLYNLMANTPYNKKMKLDYNGFVDKDTEEILTRGQKV